MVAIIGRASFENDEDDPGGGHFAKTVKVISSVQTNDLAACCAFYLVAQGSAFVGTDATFLLRRMQVDFFFFFFFFLIC